MKFNRLFLSVSITAAIAGCGADDQAYDTVDRDIYQSSFADITDNAPVRIGDCADCYEIPLDGVWAFQQTFGDVTRTSDVHPYMYDFLNEENLVTLKLRKDGLVAEKLEGDITFEGEVSRFPGDHNEPRLLTLAGDYEAYQCKEDSYGDCTNKEEKVTDPSVRWWQKTHFTPEYDQITLHDDQLLFNHYFDKQINKVLTHVEFLPKEGVINIEFEHNIVGDNTFLELGEPEKNTVFYSLVRLDTVATPGYQPVHYDLAEHDKFGFFKTSYEKLDPNFVENQQGYEGYFLNRFDPNQDKIEYYLSDEFFRKDDKGNLINKLWLDATIEGFHYMNKSLEDKFSKNGRVVPELVLVNANATEPSGVKVGDLRKNVVHIVPEASNGGGGGLGPSFANPLTGEILSAYTIMFPGNLIQSTARHWDVLANHYNNDELTADISSDAGSKPQPTRSSSSAISLSDDLNAAVAGSSSNEAQLSFEKSINDTSYNSAEEIDFAELKEKRDLRLEKMIENNIYPVDLHSISTAIEKTNITNLDFVKEGFYQEQTDQQIADGEPRKLKLWDQLTASQRKAVTDDMGAHYYRHVLAHEIGHNLGLRHNFAGSYDGHNFYSQEEVQRMGLKGVASSSSVMDYLPSKLNIQPAFGHYDRAALRFAYQRKVEVHENIDEAVLSDEEVVSAIRDLRENDKIELVDLSLKDAIKSVDLSQPSALVALENSDELWAQNKELKNYQYCTDGRGRVALESGCLVFDEGASFEQIADYHAQQYDDFFELRNSRDGRVEFNENDRSLSKYFRLLYQFNNMNMVVDDYYREFRDFEIDYSEVCPSGSSLTGEEQKRCDVATAAYKQAHFYLDILKTPEKTCNVTIEQRVWSDGSFGPVSEFLNEKFGLATMNFFAGSAGGKAYTSQLHLPTSCFDEKMNDALASGTHYFTGSSGTKYALNFKVTGESVHGEYLNKVTFADRASTEDAPSIGYEVEHLGIWMDKVLALQHLLMPSGLRGVDFALVDLPGIREELNALIDHWNLNTPLPEASALTQRFSTMPNPYEMYSVDGNGVVSNVNWAPSWSNTEIWAVPNRLSWWFNSRYGLNRSGSTPFAKAMNQVLVRYDSYRTDLYKPEAFAMRSKVSVYDYNGRVPFGHELIDVQGQPIAVDVREDSLALGKEMLESYKQSEAYLLSTYTANQLVSFQSARTAAKDNALAGLANAEQLKSSDDVSALIEFGPGVEKFVAALSTTLTDAQPFLTGGELIGAINLLYSNGDIVFQNGCYFLADVGCVFTAAGFTQSAIDMGVAYKNIWLASIDVANDTLTYLTAYVAEVNNMSDANKALLGVSNEAIDEYVQNPLKREAKKLEALDETGFRNLVVLCEDDCISSF
ncbi:hypothetical protein G5S52_09330 [Grimontia sp. S25]|uniref:EcxA zinc-binding domain-containing protein n=1 Tax=Grimontia sedimenti TaxID=2711294 RepID=A0A6M1RHW3_9GAMM|nr:zinc-dependent metalloprotease [Grimontia sedimenti]NGN97851.1 hypothetical protein [Grimontia sedimenti]